MGQTSCASVQLLRSCSELCSSVPAGTSSPGLTWLRTFLNQADTSGALAAMPLPQRRLVYTAVFELEPSIGEQLMRGEFGAAMQAAVQHNVGGGGQQEGSGAAAGSEPVPTLAQPSQPIPTVLEPSQSVPIVAQPINKGSHEQHTNAQACDDVLTSLGRFHRQTKKVLKAKCKP